MILSEAIGQVEDPLEYKDSDILAYNNSFIGVEIEYEGISYYYTKDSKTLNRELWRVVKEGSLRNGAELVFKKPLKGANIIKALKNAEDFFNRAESSGQKFKNSIRCSVHVHLDVRDLHFYEINKLLLVYMLFEKSFFEVAGAFRSKINYCRPLIGSTFSDIYEVLSDNSKQYSFIDIIRENCDKYSALNSKPITDFGSVEFRHHEGTTSFPKILEWCNLILCLKKYIITGHDVSELLSLEDPVEIVKSVFGEDYGKPLLSQNLQLNIMDRKKAVELIYVQKALKEQTKKILRKKSASKKTLLSGYVKSIEQGEMSSVA